MKALISQQRRFFIPEPAELTQKTPPPSQPLCGPVQVKVGVKDNQTTNTQVTAIMRDVGLRNYGEFNELFFCNKAVLWAVDENEWALLACRSV